MTMPRLAREPEPGPPTDRSLALAQDLRRFKVGRDVAAERCACACGCGCRAEIDVERLHLRTIELYAYLRRELRTRAVYTCRARNRSQQREQLCAADAGSPPETSDD